MQNNNPTINHPELISFTSGSNSRAQPAFIQNPVNYSNAMPSQFIPEDRSLYVQNSNPTINHSQNINIPQSDEPKPFIPNSNSVEQSVFLQNPVNYSNNIIPSQFIPENKSQLANYIYTQNRMNISHSITTDRQQGNCCSDGTPCFRMQCGHQYCINCISIPFSQKFLEFLNKLIEKNIDYLNKNTYSIGCPQQNCYNTMCISFEEVRSIAENALASYNLDIR